MACPGAGLYTGEVRGRGCRRFAYFCGPCL